MPTRHKKPRTIGDIDAFGADMSAIHKLISRHTGQLHTGGDHYRALADLHERLCEMTLAVTGESELPWVAQQRGFRWPERKP